MHRIRTPPPTTRHQTAPTPSYQGDQTAGDEGAETWATCYAG